MPRWMIDPTLERSDQSATNRTARSLIGSRLRAVEGLARVLFLRRILDGREAEEIVRKIPRKHRRLAVSAPAARSVLIGDPMRTAPGSGGSW